MGETIEYAYYKGPSDMPEIMALVDAELSEPYTIYTYHYFLDTWLVIFRGFLVCSIHTYAYMMCVIGHICVLWYVML